MVETKINTITILGANGTLGKGVSKLCATMTQAQLYLVCRDKNSAIGLVRDLEQKGANPKRLVACDYSDLPQCVKSSDWIFESVKEDLGVKQALNLKIDQHLQNGTFLSTGTSSYSIEELAFPCSSLFKKQYYGTHFFNPPERLPLLEFVPTSESDVKVTQSFKEFFEESLNRNVITLKDTRGFLANKIGILFLHEASKLAQKYSQKGGIEYIDSIMGTFTGRALPPMRTIDYIGIDVYLTILENIGSAKDLEETPRHLLSMQQRGWLGKKESGGGCYRKRLVEKENASRYQVFDIGPNSYRDQKSVCFPFAKTMITHLLQGNIDKAFKTLRMDDSLEGKICKHLLVYYIFIAHQATVGVAYEMEAIDTAMEQGYGWLSPRKMVTLLDGIQGIEEIIESNKKVSLSIEYDDLSWVDDFMTPVSENDLRFFPLKRW